MQQGTPDGHLLTRPRTGMHAMGAMRDAVAPSGVMPNLNRAGLEIGYRVRYQGEPDGYWVAACKACLPAVVEWHSDHGRDRPPVEVEAFEVEGVRSGPGDEYPAHSNCDECDEFLYDPGDLHPRRPAWGFLVERQRLLHQRLERLRKEAELREAWEDELAEEEADRAAEQVAWDRAAEAELQRREEM